MHIKTSLKFLSATTIGLILTACGGGSGGSALNNALNGTSSSASSTNTSNGATIWKIGNGSGSSFVAGAIASSTSDTLFTGDTAQLSVSVVDSAGNLTTQAKQVTFDSPCISSGASTVAGGAKAVNTINGIANITYQVGTCNSDDLVTATIANGASTAEATITLPINTRRLGSGSGSSFTEGSLDIGVGTNVLSAGGNTSVTAYIVNTNGELISDSMDVKFSSPCITAGNASITNSIAASANTVTSVDGKAMANYATQGCSGVNGIDTIKATTTFRGKVLTATGNISVKPDAAQTISFVNALPTLVSIKGTGGVETSTVTFKVTGQTGNPVKGVCVEFAPSTTVGGLALVPSKCNPSGPETYGSSTDDKGLVSTIVQAGTVPTAVRVTATTSTGISTQSNTLAVTTGIPDQNSTTLSLTDIEPVAWRHDGVQSSANIRLADAFNNTVPDGTAVTFTTSGGAIDGSCTTVNGVCSVNWRSQDPRPHPAGVVSFSNIGSLPKGYTMSCSDGSVECRNGRVKILATAIGNEAFIDGNGNGLYDDISKDIFVTSNGVYNASTKNLPVSPTPLCSPSAPNSSASYAITESCDDLGEAYVDKNFDGVRNDIEEFIDFGENALFDTGNGKYDGALCSGAAKANGDCTTNKVTVRAEALLVMSCESPYSPGGTLPGLSSFPLPPKTKYSTVILLADCNGNGMPAGTTVSLKTDDLKNATANINISGALGMSTEPTTFILNVTADEDINKIPSGTVTVIVTAAGLSTSYTVFIL